MWSGGPGQEATQQVRGGQSYFCIYGKKTLDEALQVLKDLHAMNHKRDTIAACGTYNDTSSKGPKELLANGNTYENVDFGTSMTRIENIHCGICMVFR